jgi:hypothetical protein
MVIPRISVTLIALMTLSGACLAQEAPQNLLRNPGFEAEGDWGMRPPEMISYDDTIARSGERSLKISDTEGQSNPWAPQAVTELDGGATYTLSAWYRTPPEGMGEQWAAALKIEFYNAEGENTKGKYARSTEATGGEWREISKTAVAPPDTTRAAVLVRLFGGGTVWFDDCAFIEAEAAPAVALTPARQKADPGAEQFAVTARLADPAGADEPPLEIRVSEATGDRIESDATIKRVDASTYEITVELGEMLGSGSYRVQAFLGDTPGSEAWVHVPLAERKPTNLTDSGTILVGGEPFFPMGLYHVSSSHLPMIAEAGFNCIQGSNTMDLEKFGASLDAAAEYGMMVDVPLYWEGKVLENLPTSLQKIEQYADHPAVMCWKIIDEPTRTIRSS